MVSLNVTYYWGCTYAYTVQVATLSLNVLCNNVCHNTIRSKLENTTYTQCVTTHVKYIGNYQFYNVVCD